MAKDKDKGKKRLRMVESSPERVSSSPSPTRKKKKDKGDRRYTDISSFASVPSSATSPVRGTPVRSTSPPKTSKTTPTGSKNSPNQTFTSQASSPSRAATVTLDSTEGRKKKKNKNKKKENDDGPFHEDLALLADPAVLEDMEFDEDQLNEAIGDIERVELDASKVGGDKEWPKKDLETLMEKVKDQLPPNDIRYKHETTLKKVDWNQVAFPFYNGEECRKKFEQIISKVRSHRTLTEMIVDADRYVKSGRLEYDTNAKMSLKDKPRRPLTPFFMFFRDNKERVKRELGDKVTMHFMSKKLSEDFAQIPRKIRRKYEKEYRAQMEQWKIKMDEWRKNHPELLIKPKYQSSRQVTGEPIRPKPPFQHYFEDRLKRDLSGEDGTPGEGLTAEEFEAKKEHLKEKWSRLPDKKKIKYIIMSFDEEQLYRNEMKEFRKNHPDREAPKRQRSVLSKEEQRTLERAQGIPHRPPNSGWAYYSAMILKETKEDGQTPKDRLVTISEKWKDLPVHEKEYWNQEAKRALLKYYDQLERYIDGLPDDKKAEAIAKLPKLPSKRKISEIEKIMEKRSLTVDHRLLDTLSKHPIIAINAYNIYASERVTELEKNGVAKAKATKKAYKEWDSKMTLAKKAKYLKKAYEDSGIKVKVKGLTVGRKQKLDPSNLPEGCPPLDENNKILVERMRDRLPKKPPRTGYALFSQETLAKLTKDRKSMTEKMTEVGHQWSGLPKDKKDKYNHRSAEATKKHEAEMTTFLHSLSPLEYKLYEYYVRDAKTTAQEQKSTKLKDVFNTSRQPVGYDPKVSSEEEEKDSSSEEEEDDEDDKSNQKDKDDDESSSSSDDEDEFPRSSPSKPTPVKLPSLKTVSFSKPPSSPVKSSAGSSSPSKSPQSPLKIQTSFQQQAKSGKASPSKLVTSTPKPVSTPASKTSPHKVTAPAPPPPQRITVESSSAESSSESDSDSD